MSASRQPATWHRDFGLGIALALILPFGILVIRLISERPGTLFLTLVLYGGLIQFIYLLPAMLVAWRSGYRSFAIGLGVGDGLLVLFNGWVLSYSGMELP